MKSDSPESILGPYVTAEVKFFLADEQKCQELSLELLRHIGKFQTQSGSLPISINFIFEDTSGDDIEETAEDEQHLDSVISSQFDDNDDDGEE